MLSSTSPIKWAGGDNKKVIKKLLKTRLGEKKGAWVDELLGVL